MSEAGWDPERIYTLPWGSCHPTELADFTNSGLFPCALQALGWDGIGDLVLFS